MKTKIIFTLLIILPLTGLAASNKALPLSPGTEWVLLKDLQMQKAPSTPDDSGHYAAIWNLKSKAFSKNLGPHSKDKDSCLIKSIATPENLSDPALVLKKQTSFKFVGMQDAPSPSVIFEITVNGAQKEEVNQIQFVCTSYEKNLNSEKDKKEFRDLIANSLGSVFSVKK